MANSFKTIVKIVPDEIGLPLYTCPNNKFAVVILAQVANVTNNTVNVTFYHSRLNDVNEREYFELLMNSPIPTRDARSMLSGRLVLQPGDQIYCVASAPNSSKITVSLLESDP